MSRIHNHTALRLNYSILALIGMLLPFSCLAITADEAMSLVKQSMCKDGLTIEQVLDRSIKSTYQRDVGWRHFQEESYIDIERAVLINKSSELRYRWRVDLSGTMVPQSDRAEKLCS